MAIGRPPSGRYPVRDLVCRICGAFFRARHGRRCRTCRTASEYTRHPCSCGAPKHPKAKACRSCEASSRTAEKNARWKGGRFVAATGYASVRIDGRYFPEHRVVMEQVLGRSLLAGESVHHRNGVRDDNRPENLELWVKAQPAGQRVEDVVAWAREIVARYDSGTVRP